MSAGRLARLATENLRRDPAELAALGRRFGKPRIHSLVDYRHNDLPEVSWLTNVDKDGNIDGSASNRN